MLDGVAVWPICKKDMDDNSLVGFWDSMLSSAVDIITVEELLGWGTMYEDLYVPIWQGGIYHCFDIEAVTLIGKLNPDSFATIQNLNAEFFDPDFKEDLAHMGGARLGKFGTTRNYPSNSQCNYIDYFTKKTEKYRYY